MENYKPRGIIDNSKSLQEMKDVSRGDYFYCRDTGDIIIVKKITSTGKKIVDVFSEKEWKVLERKNFPTKEHAFPKDGYSSGVLYRMTHVADLRFRLIGWVDGRTGLKNLCANIGKGIFRDALPKDPYVGRTYAVWDKHLDCKIHECDCFSDNSKKKNGKKNDGFFVCVKIVNGNPKWRHITGAEMRKERLFHYPKEIKTPELLAFERKEKRDARLFKKTGFRYMEKYGEWWRRSSDKSRNRELLDLINNLKSKSRNPISFGGIWDVHGRKRSNSPSHSILEVFGGFNGASKKHKASGYVSVVKDLLFAMEKIFSHVWLISYHSNCSDCHNFLIGYDSTSRLKGQK